MTWNLTLASAFYPHCFLYVLRKVFYKIEGSRRRLWPKIHYYCTRRLFPSSGSTLNSYLWDVSLFKIKILGIKILRFIAYYSGNLCLLRYLKELENYLTYPYHISFDVYVLRQKWVSLVPLAYACDNSTLLF